MDLDSKYRIVYDDNNVVLQFHEKRKRVKVKTGVEEDYEYVDNFYYSNMKQALKNYVNKSLKGAESIDKLIIAIEKLETKIDNLN